MEIQPSLFEDVLKKVSRTFYLSIRILPSDLRKSIGLAYLFARAADTIADTRLIDQKKRLEYLEVFRSLFRRYDVLSLRKIQDVLTGPQKIPEERELLSRLEECFLVYESLPRDDREKVKEVILLITQGMQFDLTMFPGESEGRLVPLSSRQELDRYTYLVAGCVGEFWTDIHRAHRTSLKNWGGADVKEKGVRLGKGLQMTNILRDISQDIRIGRCYLPQQDLEKCGLKPKDLLESQAITQLKPLLLELLSLTLAHYDEGWRYILSIPRREFQMRLACAWPLFIGLKTLELVVSSENLLNGSKRVKISRGNVYETLIFSILIVGSNAWMNWYYKHLRQKVRLV